jgi:hypothetical protein
MSMQSPPYITGDFDGDGVMDAAVLVERRTTGKLGVAVVHRGTRKVTHALWVERNHSMGGFYIWTGSSFTYEPHRLLPR